MTLRVVQVDEALWRLNAAAAAAARQVNLMEVCGTHTVAAFRSGLHSLMPANVRLLSGPGCPVCVTSQGDIDLLIGAASVGGVTLCTYGDMLRVTGSGRPSPQPCPTSGRGGQTDSLEKARSRGADVRIVYSALDAVKLAAEDSSRQVVFAAVGFETTTPPTAVAVTEAQKRGLTNFTVLVSHKLILPAMRALLDGGEVNVQGFMLPGHVSVILGAEAYRPIVEQYHVPCVIAGFEGNQIAAAVARLTEMIRDGQALLENQYPQAVTPGGNVRAQEIINQVFEPVDAPWRGIGVIPLSGLGLRREYAAFDAAARFGLQRAEAPEPAGCRCGEVITGKCTPAECALFGKACTPINPIGPCMVSSEGTCQAWFKYGRRHEGTKARRHEVGVAG